MQSEGNAPKNGEPTVGFSINTMLQHTGRFWSMVSYHKTLRQHWNIPFAPLICLDLIFTFSLPWNLQGRDGVFTDNFKNVVEDLKRLSQSYFLECYQYFYCRWQNCVVAQGAILKEMKLKWFTLLHFSEIKWFREHFEATTYFNPVKNVPSVLTRTLKYPTTYFTCHQI